MGATEVSSMLDQLMRELVAGTIPPVADAQDEVRPWLDDLLSRTDTYRDAALIVLAFAVDGGSAAEVTTPPDGRRGVAQRLAGLLDELNIRARRDAFQT